jgi:hypothetical protein
MNIEEEVPMKTKRPAVITIAAILLLILSVFVAGLGIASQYGLLGQGFGGGVFVAGQVRNRNFNSQGGFPQGGFPQGGLPNDQNNPGGTQNFTPNRQAGVGLAGLFRLIQPATMVLDVILLVLAVVAAIGLFKSKRWGAVLGIILSVLLILLTIPGMLRIFSTLLLAENLTRIILADRPAVVTISSQGLSSSPGR